MGYEQMGDRGPFRFMVAAVSGQSHQREQGHWERATAHQQQGDHRFKDGGHHLAAKRYLSGSAVPSIQNQVRGSRFHQGHGGQAGPLGLPHAPLRDAVRRQRSGDLPGAAPAVTDQAAQVESRHPGIPTHRSSSGLRSTSFWGGGFMNTHPYLRAYMAGISVPTPLLLVALTVFSIARFVCHVPVPVERVIIFPMAIIPNLFGLWNMLHLASRSSTNLPLGVHGAILPFILAPGGFLLARALGFLQPTEHGFVYFGLFNVSYWSLLVVFSTVVVVYYLLWKYALGFLNHLL